jgi:hypothetical protein
MIIDSGRIALARQKHLKAVNSLETYNEELTQLKVFILILRLIFEYCVYRNKQ